MENIGELPKHIAIILDGNRRWAKAKGLPAAAGHKAGAEVIEKIAKFANRIGLKYLTVYAFSTENWKRTQDEVKGLMVLLERYIKFFIDAQDKENIRLNFIGDMEGLSPKMQADMVEAMENSKNNTGMTFNIALNYGGRAEIINAVKKISEQVKNGSLDLNDITETTISDNLYTANQPDPDLVIRTSGELRTSNFLPWQIVYSELYFPEKYWPDFTEDDLLKAIEIYQTRNRRFGGK